MSLLKTIKGLFTNVTCINLKLIITQPLVTHKAETTQLSGPKKISCPNAIPNSLLTRAQRPPANHTPYLGLRQLSQR